MSMTLDGYVGGPAGEIDWILRTLDAEAASSIEEILWQAGAHFVGRRTYADMASYWPTSTEPLAAPMNAIPKIVFSSSDSPTYEPTTALQNATDARTRARDSTLEGRLCMGRHPNAQRRPEHADQGL